MLYQDDPIRVLSDDQVVFPKRYQQHEFFQRAITGEYHPVDGYPEDEVVIDYETQRPVVKTPLPVYAELVGKLTEGEELWYFHDSGFTYRGGRIADEQAFNALITAYKEDPNSFCQLRFWAK